MGRGRARRRKKKKERNAGAADIAYMRPVVNVRHALTLPKPPRPRTRKQLKSSILGFISEIFLNLRYVR